MSNLNWKSIGWGTFACLLLGTIVTGVCEMILTRHNYATLKHNYIYRNLVNSVCFIVAGYVSFGDSRLRSIRNSLVIPTVLTVWTILVDLFYWLNYAPPRHLWLLTWLLSTVISFVSAIMGGYIRSRKPNRQHRVLDVASSPLPEIPHK